MVTLSLLPFPRCTVIRLSRNSMSFTLNLKHSISLGFLATSTRFSLESDGLLCILELAEKRKGTKTIPRSDGSSQGKA